VSDISLSIDTVSLDQSICVLIQQLRRFARDQLNMYLSDRRLVKAARLLRVSAVSNGRAQVDLVDCLLLEHIFWQIPEQQAAVREWMLDNLTPGNDIIEQSRFLLSGLVSEALVLVKKTSGDVTGESGARGQDLDAIKSVKKEITQIRDLLETHSQKVERHIALLENLPQHLWISQDSAYSAKQYLAPLALAAAEEVDKVLIEAASLFNTLTDVIANDVRSPLIESLQEDGGDIESFTEDELALSLKEAKRKYDGDALRKWKSARRKQIE
jgi:MoxR-like ATPase